MYALIFDAKYMRLRAVAIIIFVSLPLAHGAALVNPDFETGDLDGWQLVADQMTIAASTNDTFNRNYSARMSGSIVGANWVTNSISQTITAMAGDQLQALGFVNWKAFNTETASAQGYVEVALDGAVSGGRQRWDAPPNGWRFFDLSGWLFGVIDGHFESGTLRNWNIGNDHLVATMDHDAFDGDNALRFAGAWSGGWSFNQGYQILCLKSGDVINANARIKVRDLRNHPAGWIVAGIKLELEGTAHYAEAAVQGGAATGVWTQLQFDMFIPQDGCYVFRCMVCGDSGAGVNTADVSFDDVRVWKKPVGVADGSFERGTNTAAVWTIGADHLATAATTNRRSSGAYALRMNGGWNGWSFNQAYQLVYLRSGDVVAARGRIYLDRLDASAGWLVSGIKLEPAAGGYGVESVYDNNAPEDQWLDLAFDTRITNQGWYVYRCMTCGDVGGGAANCDVYFDDIGIWKQGEPTGAVVNATLTMKFVGTAGGPGRAATADIFFDAVTLEGSTAGLEPPSAAADRLRAAAETVGANPAAPIPPVVYPPIYSYGYPGNETNEIRFPASVQGLFAGWRFRYFTNDVVLAVTNTIIIGELARGPAYIEFDRYAYCGRFWHTVRGAAVQLATNPPYFALGERDGASAEFGNGPFPAEHTYIVGTPLSNFPRRLVTGYDGRWPTRLNVVFSENFVNFDRSWDKYFMLDTVISNGAATGTKAVKLFLSANDPAATNLALKTQEIHMGWAGDEECFGKIDYPNCTYQDHNEVALRAGWLYSLLDRDGWFALQVPRGSATIEPMDLYPLRGGNWLKKVYEEYLFSWPNAASGVRSLLDGDDVHRLPGPGSYHVGFKMGHQCGTNEFGEPQYPQVIEVRGNGYFRMTDYNGVMGGSFRPVAADIFGLYQNREDAPLMPQAYTRLVDRTTPSNQADNSFAQFHLPFQSKTNQALIGLLGVDAHFAPDEVISNGVYLDITADTWTHRPLIRSNDGPLACFAQVDMFWRGSEGINDHTDGHDLDQIMVQRTDGEWVTHLPVNPPTNIARVTVSSFRSNDTVYLMQQDRGAQSYGFDTEAPYRKVSSFEITLLDDGGLDCGLDVYQQNTISEINDNVVIACNIRKDFAAGERAHYKYRYRGLYAPGVSIINPNETGGAENWSNNAYLIEFDATDGEDRPLQAEVFYGSGRDGEWHLINTGEQIAVPTNTHRGRCVWNTAGVAPGAYYIKVTARPISGGRAGFDVSNTRLQVGPTLGFVENGATNVTITTNQYGQVCANGGFESGDVLGWASAGDHLDIWADNARAYSGQYAARMQGSFTGWSWNNLQQEIPCVSGETLRVIGKVFIGRLAKAGTNWLACGVKLESTNGAAYSQAGREFVAGAQTGIWLNVDFERIAPVTGTDRLLLWVGGHDAAAADVLFDDIRVLSQINGTVVTNRLRTGYWEGDVAADVRAQQALSFWAAGADARLGYVWVVDQAGVSNRVYFTNCVAYAGSLPRRIDAPWTNFTGVNRATIRALGFGSDGTNPVTASRVRSIADPIRVRSEFQSAPQTDREGLPHFNPGETVTQILTIENLSGAALSGLSVQAVQEYAEVTYWRDESPGVESRMSEQTRRGGRLCGDYEQIWSGCALPAGGRLVLTNTYTLPVGKLIDHLAHAMPAGADWWFDRNFAARARTHLCIRGAAGPALFDHDEVGLFSMDNDFDLDNDRLPDAWETLYSGSNTALRPGDDLDGDGLTNLEEYQAGTDPLTPNNGGSDYILHLAYTNGNDLFPWAAAERSNFTGAASAWMVARYLAGPSFNLTQTQIYNQTTHSAAHGGEITPASCAIWLDNAVDPGYYFSARSRTNLTGALMESVYWMDFVPPPGQKAPVFILSGTNWSYKVLRGFQTDIKPYDGASGLTNGRNYTVYGMWFNDPAVHGLGYNVYATAAEMSQVYRPSESDGRYWLVAEPPEDPTEMAAAQSRIDGAALTLAAPAGDPAAAAFLRTLSGGASPTRRRGDGGPAFDLWPLVPPVLRQDTGFAAAFYRAGTTNYYPVNAGIPGAEYVLAAGGERGPGSTVFIMKLDPTNGAFQQATWSVQSSMFPPVSLAAAVWSARRGLPETNTLSALSLRNASFETNTGEGGQAVDWISGGAVEIHSWSASAGGWGMAACGWRGMDYAYFYQDYAAGQAGGDYEFSIRADKDAGFNASVCELKLEWFTAAGDPLGAAASNVYAQLTPGFKTVTVRGSAPTGTGRVRCTVWIGGIQASGAALKMDEAALAQRVLGPSLIDAQLVYDPDHDVSPFLPRWRLRFSSGGQTVIREVSQNLDLSGDSDGDGLSDARELYLGSDPTNRASAFVIDAMNHINDGGLKGVLSWPSVAGKYYSVYRANGLAAGFQRIWTHLPATPPVNTVTNALPTATTYFRVEVE